MYPSRVFTPNFSLAVLPRRPHRRRRRRRRHPLLMLLLASACSPGVESYRDFVTRANPPLPPALADALTPDSAAADLASLVAENEQSLDLLTASRPAAVDAPTADARVAVPLMVQAVRDWSADGVSQRATSYAPLVAGLRERLGAVSSAAARVLVPGSGLGRLAFDISEEFSGSEVVAVEPDVHSQLL